jgi:glycosyltransferase involved in cell wall biosynthesis
VAWHHDLAWTMESHRPALHPGEPWDLIRTAWPGVVQVAVSGARRVQLAALMAIDPAAVRVVPNGLDIGEDLGLVPETRDLIAVTDLLAADPLLLTPARLTPRKNIELGLEVVARLRADGRAAALVVTGPVDPHDRAQGAYLRQLRGLRTRLGLEGAAWLLASDLGAEPSDRLVADLYRIADVLFLPSLEEGFGLPLLEAALHRLPIVCSDLPVLHEVAGNAATYLPPGIGAQEAADSILARLERDPEASLWRHVRRDYAWPAIFREGIAPLLGAEAG